MFTNTNVFCCERVEMEDVFAGAESLSVNQAQADATSSRLLLSPAFRLAGGTRAAFDDPVPFLEPPGGDELAALSTEPHLETRKNQARRDRDEGEQPAFFTL